MKHYMTRKNNKKMKGGQAVAPPPYANINPNQITPYLAQFQQQASILKDFANQYNSVTNALNDTTKMTTHLNVASSLAAQAKQVYDAAQALYKKIYGVNWVPPPSPAPAPGP